MKRYSHCVMIMVLALLLLQSCSRHEKLPHSHLQTIAPRAYSSTLFYSGTIQPIRSVVIPSPADGVVVDMPVQYGDTVKPGQLLFTLSSSKFVSDYKTALMAYVKAKNDFNNNQTLLDEAKFLHKNELISDDDFKSKESNYYGAQLALLQAKDALESLIHQTDIKDANLYNLSIADIDKITQAIHSQLSADNLRIAAIAQGSILSASKNEEDNKKVMKGDLVKQGDVLAIIGDMSGVSVKIKVNELTINQLQVGQKVKVTGIAFPDEMLMGEVQQVDRQGEISNGGLPTFTVRVTVPVLSAAQQKIIHAGMSAKVEIDINENPHLMAPIKSLADKNGESFVKVYDKQSRQTHDVAVKTGKTTMDSVEILSGLKAGDKIVIPD